MVLFCKYVFVFAFFLTHLSLFIMLPLQVIIFLTDHKTSKKRESHQVESQMKKLAGIKLLQVCIGPYVDIRELETITGEKHHVIHVGECKNPVNIAKNIWHGKEMLFIISNTNFQNSMDCNKTSFTVC